MSELNHDDSTCGNRARFGKRTREWVVWLAAPVSCVGLHSVTHAQVAPRGVEEIVVTATRREARLQDIPLSAAAIDATAMEARGLVGFTDYLRSVPAVSYIDQGPGQNTFVIRGAYADSFTTGPTVGVYFGDIPLTGLALGASADVRLVDMDRTEVLRGPQGTLYGSNSLSGTVRNIPARPDLDTFSGRVHVGYSSTTKNGGNDSQVEGVVNIPIVENRLALRAVGYRIEDVGYVKNVAGTDPNLQTAAAFFGASDLARNDDHVGGSTIYGGRVSLLWQASDNLSVGLNYLHQLDAADDRPFAQLGLGEYERSGYRFAPVAGTKDPLKIDLDIANLTVDYDAQWGSFTSSTALIDQDFRRMLEIGLFFPSNGLVPPVSQDSITHARLFTQEVRFVSAFSGPVQVIAGVYYEDSEQPTRQPTYFGGNPALNNLSYAPGVVQLYEPKTDAQVQQKALFGEISFDVTEKIRLTAGGRAFEYDTDYLDARVQSANQTVRPLYFRPSSSSESGNTLKAGVEYRPTKGILTYASYAQGFRLGRPKTVDLIRTTCDRNNDGLIDNTQLSATDPLIDSDSLDSYEVGAKSTLFGGRAALSAAAYRNNWNDMPANFGGFSACPTIRTVFNVGKVRVNGFELEGSFRPVDALQLDFGYGYVDSEIANTTPLGPKGARMNFVPKDNGHLGAEYAMDIAGRDSSIRADYSFYGSYYTGLGETGQRFDSYGIVDVSFNMNFQMFDLRLFANNVTDKYAITSSSAFPANGIYLVPPRTIGARIGVSF